MKRAALALLLCACGPLPCEDWRETEWRAPEVEACVGVTTLRGGAIVILGMDDGACPEARSCTMLTPGRDETATRYMRLPDGPAAPILHFGVDCAANTCEEIETTALGDGP